jgi:transcription elongation factor Elf1
MPTVIDTKDIEIDFSTYCGICGAGTCGDTTVSTRRNDVTVTCSKCQQNIANLEFEIESLKSEIDTLEEKIATMEVKDEV